MSDIKKELERWLFLKEEIKAKVETYNALGKELDGLKNENRSIEALYANIDTVYKVNGRYIRAHGGNYGYLSEETVQDMDA